MRKSLVIALAASVTATANAQISSKQIAGQLNTITTMVPFLTISPDSRSAGMGDAGVALFSPDANSISWNMANMVNAEKKTGFSLSYAPWLRQLVDDVGFSYLSGYTKLSDNSAVAGAIRYFSLGNINFTDINGDPTGNFNPNEFSIEGGYSTRFSKSFSMGVNLRFIYSNIAGNRVLNGISMKPGYSGAGDVNLLYKTKLKIAGKQDDFNFGVNIQNMGAKMTYTTKDSRDFIPTNLKIGIGLKHEIDQYNKLNTYLDVNKLLVPTRPVYFQSYKGGDSTDGSGKKVISNGMDPNGVSVVQGMVQSFYDAPGGFKEELNEWNISYGMEYWYMNQFAGRLGVFYESNKKGGRQYLTFGLGFKYQKMALDAAMLVPFFKNHPLQNQLRFSLLFDLGSLKDE
ncbi:MAG: type IX secretion system outer membrane channel protein PorV [Bacteroidetes bacterium]|nr:type IX secretion system outer membrane channel protein PorV [Bacteroidota bacterium]